HMARLDLLGNGQGDQESGSPSSDGQQGRSLRVAAKFGAGAGVHGDAQGRGPPGGHQAASLPGWAIGRPALMPVARSEEPSRLVRSTTYGVTVRFSNSTGSNGARVGGTGIRSATTLTTTSRDRPDSSGSRSMTRTWNTGLPVSLSAAGERRLVSSSSSIASLIESGSR